MNYPQHLVGWFLDLLFPAKCIFCGLILGDNKYVCHKCLRSIPLYKKFECIGCRRYSKFGRTCFVCRKGNFVDHIFVVSDYGNNKIKKALKTSRDPESCWKSLEKEIVKIRREDESEEAQLKNEEVVGHE